MFYECNNLVTAHLSFKEGVQYNANEMFSACRNMRYLSLDFSNITSARDMFYDCYSLEKIDIPKKLSKAEIALYEQLKQLSKHSIREKVDE